jgi:hypothetical protein
MQDQNRVGRRVPTAARRGLATTNRGGIRDMKLRMMFGLPGIAAVYPEECLQLWPCSYIAGCSAPGYRRRATAILRCLESKGRFDNQTHACEAHANELCAAFRLPQFGSYLVPGVGSRPSYRATIFNATIARCRDGAAEATRSRPQTTA